MVTLASVGWISDLIGPLDWAALVRIALAAGLGGLVGWERERHGREAGLRTHLLLCVGCTLMMLVSLYLPTKFADQTSESVVRADPSRLASQVVTGLGFLGAGTILVLGRRVRGLTTAASIWITAAIGLAVGAGYLVPAVFCWLVTMFALLALVHLEKHMPAKDRYANLRLRFGGDEPRAREVRSILDAHGFTILNLVVDQEDGARAYRLSLRYARPIDFEQVCDDLLESLGEHGLTTVRWH